MISVMPNTDMVKGDVASPSIKYRSVRKLFGKHEQIYIMDAKKSGNLGRYFNVSFLLSMQLRKYFKIKSTSSIPATRTCLCRTCLWTRTICASRGWHSSR